jgi:Cys-tRNA synthase (O-phospho-L-seryl-tRNA:Cys-tRNA synthase)
MGSAQEEASHISACDLPATGKDPVFDTLVVAGHAVVILLFEHPDLHSIGEQARRQVYYLYKRVGWWSRRALMSLCQDGGTRFCC